jgi:hypothetical protein
MTTPTVIDILIGVWLAGIVVLIITAACAPSDSAQGQRFRTVGLADLLTWDHTHALVPAKFAGMTLDAFQGNPERNGMHSLEGILQRVDYPGKELTILVQGQVWHLTLAADCQLWFDDHEAILRCFHPLDRVVIKLADGDIHLVKAMYAWENRAA